MADSSDFDPSRLSPSQQEALQQYTQLTNQEIKDAVPLLERSQWNVQIAIAKFFDGEGPDPVAEAMAAQNNPRPVAVTHGNLQESLMAASTSNARSPRTNRPDPAPRIVPQQPVVRQGGLIMSAILAPFNLGWRFTSAIFRTFCYFMSFIPFPFRNRGVGASLRPTLKKNMTGRRTLSPRDTAARFRREFEEEYGSTQLPFFEGGFAQALDLAKSELRFLLVVLMSPEHDDTEAFNKGTLLAPEVVDYVSNPENNIILWGGNVMDTEAYQVSLEYSCTKFPFSAVISLTPKEGSTRMGIIKRLSGPMPAQTYLSEIQKAISKYAPELAGVRAQRAEQEMARNLRSAQDEAYERSLAADRERARQRREAEAAAAEAERRAREDAAAAEVLGQKREQWRQWRATQIVPEPPANSKAVVRVAIKMLTGDRVVRRFDEGVSLDELYAFVECFDILSGANKASGLTEPEGYTHQYRFRVVSIMPREVYDPKDAGTLRDKIGRSGNLIVEDLDEE